MTAEASLDVYLAEIRQQVCSRCVERPAGGPPCGPLGKPCGVELHLPELITAIHGIHSESIAPYLDSEHQFVCENCSFRHSGHCPCPMDRLMVLVTQAVETVDGRHMHLQEGRRSLLRRN